MQRMNRWAHKPTTNTLALAAAVALAFAPVDLLAFCGCAACGCSVAAENASCCCVGESNVRVCCGSDVAASADGCSCSKSAPVLPIGTLPVSGNLNDLPAPAAHITLLPIVESDGSHWLTSTQHQPLWPVPARILLCVWRN
jgi:hypothetical protein